MQFTREISTLLLALIIGFIIIVLSASYWAIVGPDTILDREDNARLVEDEANLQRGSIYDRQHTLLAGSEYDDTDTLIRTYPIPALYSALGYFSLRYGVGGAESAFNTILRGDDLPYNLSSYFQEDILHIPQEGSDIQLTLDYGIQQTIVEDMNSITGAVILQSVPNGEIIAMVSQPTIDPNSLDENWENLVEDETQPFFNRALQGNYQPGGILYIALMTSGLSNSYALNDLIENPTQNITLSDITLTCLHETDNTPLSFNDSFIAGCPYPMTLLAEGIGLTRIQSSIERFLTDAPPTLQNFINEPQNDELPEPTPEATQEPVQITLDDALGQGNITITPLSVNLMTSALINNGNAPDPQILLAIREPESEDWVNIEISGQSIPLMTLTTANYVRDLLVQSTEQVSGEYDIGGYTAIAFTGEQINTWFIGFVETPNHTGFAITILLEQTDNIQLAQEIGFNALISAIENPN